MLISEQVDECLILACTIDTGNDSIAVIKEYDEQLKIFFDHWISDDESVGQVWILFGYEKDSQKAEALQVGQSKDAKKEIMDLLRPMYNYLYLKKREEKYNLDDLSDAKEAVTDGGGTYMYKPGVYNRRQYLYRYLFRRYAKLEFYILDIDRYLKPSPTLRGNEKIIYDLAKDYYAEAKLAFDSKAKYWNYYNSGLDARTYTFLH